MRYEHSANSLSLSYIQIINTIHTVLGANTVEFSRVLQKQHSCKMPKVKFKLRGLWGRKVLVLGILALSVYEINKQKNI